MPVFATMAEMFLPSLKHPAITCLGDAVCVGFGQLPAVGWSRPQKTLSGEIPFPDPSHASRHDHSWESGVSREESRVLCRDCAQLGLDCLRRTELRAWVAALRLSPEA